MIEAERLSNREFTILTKAYEIRKQDEERAAATQAWFNQSVQSTEEKVIRGKKQQVPVYKTFAQFYDSKNNFYNLFRESKENNKAKVQKKSTLAERNRRLNQRRKEETNG